MNEGTRMTTARDDIVRVHPLVVRITHWINALSILIMVASGWRMKLRIPTKLGFKNPKHIVAMFVTNEYPGGYWEDQGYNWFSGS
jgi:DMSO/TMAO reductase YedYZ molybdopterin-dependent catalytic subunit